MVYPKFRTRPYPITLLFLYMFPVNYFMETQYKTFRDYCFILIFLIFVHLL